MKATMRFFRHGGIYGSDVSFFFKPGPTPTAFRPGTTQAVRAHRKVLRPTHRRDEFRPAIPQRDARQQSPSPLHRHAHPKSVPGSGTMNLQRTVNSVLTVCLSPGDHPTPQREQFARPQPKHQEHLDNEAITTAHRIEKLRDFSDRECSSARSSRLRQLQFARRIALKIPLFNSLI